MTMKMKMKKLAFGEQAEAADTRQGARRAKSLLFAMLFVAFGALFVSVYLEKNIEATGDRAHLTNPAGPEATVALRAAGEDPAAVNAEATAYMGTRWLEVVAMVAGIIALFASAYLCVTAVSKHGPAQEEAEDRQAHSTRRAA